MHKLIADFINWRWSSYSSLLSNAETKLLKKEVLNLFGGKSHFIDFHKTNAELLNEKFIIE